MNDEKFPTLTMIKIIVCLCKDFLTELCFMCDCSIGMTAVLQCLKSTIKGCGHCKCRAKTNNIEYSNSFEAIILIRNIKITIKMADTSSYNEESLSVSATTSDTGG